ncbi:MAG: hypothetical protein J6B44_04505 [Muribaculaceae bacterium]|nr:hypothetical protein [Muribaculaceae bacterium]
MRRNTIAKLSILFAALISVSLLSSCSKDDAGTDDPFGWEDPDVPGGNAGTALAPSSLIGKILMWNESNDDGTAGNRNVRVKIVNATDMQTNFSDWTTYTYRKTSSKKAHLNFMAPVNAAGVVRTFQYDFDIDYMTASTFKVDGRLTVNILSGPNVGRTVVQYFTGNGKYVDSLYGSNQNDDEPQGPGTPENVAKYVGNWEEDAEKSPLGNSSYTFKENGTFSFARRLWLTTSTGTFTCTGSSVTLKITAGESIGETRQLVWSGSKLRDTSTGKLYIKK